MDLNSTVSLGRFSVCLDMNVILCMVGTSLELSRQWGDLCSSLCSQGPKAKIWPWGFPHGFNWWRIWRGWRERRESRSIGKAHLANRQNIIRLPLELLRNTSVWLYSICYQLGWVGEYNLPTPSVPKLKTKRRSKCFEFSLCLDA